MVSHALRVGVEVLLVLVVVLVVFVAVVLVESTVGGVVDVVSSCAFVPIRATDNRRKTTHTSLFITTQDVAVLQ